MVNQIQLEKQLNALKGTIELHKQQFGGGEKKDIMCSAEQQQQNKTPKPRDPEISLIDQYIAEDTMYKNKDLNEIKSYAGPNVLPDTFKNLGD